MLYFNFKKFFEPVLETLFPKKCLSCQKEGKWLCDHCFQKIKILSSSFCPACARETENWQFCFNCQRYFQLSGVLIASRFENPLKEVIHYFKYNRVLELADPLAEILFSKLEEGFPEGDLVLVPIPLHPQKERERGFNQSLVLAEKIADAFDIPVFRALKKIKNTPSQFSLKRRERWQNIKDAFEIKKREQGKIKNKTILLVDDVMTTGATLNEAAKVLKKAGAQKAWGLVLAKG